MTWLLVLLYFTATVSTCCGEYYTNTWAVHIEGGVQTAKRLAEKYGFVYLDQILPNHYHFQHRKVSRRSLTPTSSYHEQLKLEPKVRWLEQQVAKRRVKRDDEKYFQDPEWPKQWYMNRGPNLDLNLLPAYEKWRVSGKDVVVSILDDGIEKDHPDLQQNYDEKASYDVNGHDSDPQPRYDDRNENRHGTRCAGEVAAQANNNICGVGIAYNAKIGGVRMLDGEVTDAVEAQALSLNPQHIDIYSASWGPDDDGRTVDGPGPLARKAFADGITMGRRGLGSVFVWASGNGGRDEDSCNCDGYTNSLYTLSISSATESGAVPWYSEACSSTLATTYSSGSMSDRQIVTTDLRKQCTATHTGTSASAPLAAGICALVLEANPLLTWRDMQHIVVLTSRVANLAADDWVTNGVGRKVSHHFGFGLMDASAMVEQAVSWENVPEQRRCEVPAANFTARTIPVNGLIEITLDTNGCKGTVSEVNFLEHVEAVITLSTSLRGQIQLYLTSPAGTRSTLLNHRIRDSSTDGFNAWPFMTTHNWGESPRGQWLLEVKNGDSVAMLKNWTLVLYGTATDPISQSESQRRRLQPDEVSCSADEFLLKPFCYKVCPRAYYGTRQRTGASGESAQNVSFCEQCHISCVHCWGPGEDQCSECVAQHQLTYDHRCVILPPEPSRSDSRLNMILLIVIPIVSILVIAVLVLLLVTKSRLLCRDLGHHRSSDVFNGSEENKLLLDEEQNSLWIETS